jgi:hypothetical protein
MEGYNLRLWLPLAILFFAGFVGFVIPAVTGGIVALGQMSGITADWAGFAGSIIAAIITVSVAGAGVIAAWFAIKGQNRINILAREEDRIERRLPGLYDVSHFCRPIVSTLGAVKGFYSITDVFQSFGLGLPNSTFKKDVENALPNTDDPTRRNIGSALGYMHSCARAAQITLGMISATNERIRLPSEWEPSALAEVRAQIIAMEAQLEAQKAEFRIAVEFMGRLVSAFEDQVAKYEARLAMIRRELDEFFKREGDSLKAL